jgi:hypothetical protein
MIGFLMYARHLPWSTKKRRIYPYISDGNGDVLRRGQRNTPVNIKRHDVRSISKGLFGTAKRWLGLDIHSNAQALLHHRDKCGRLGQRLARRRAKRRRGARDGPLSNRADKDLLLLRRAETGSVAFTLS